MRLKQFVRIALFILALCFLTESLGYLTHELYRYAGAVLLVFYGLSIVPFGSKTEKAGLFFLGWLLLILSFLLPGGPVPSRLAGAALFVFALHLLARSKGAEQQELPVLLAATVLTYGFSLLYLYSPPFWFWLKEVSLLFSTAVSRLSGIPVLFSSTFLGVTISFIFLAAIALVFFCCGRRKPRLLFLSLLALPALNGLYLVIMGLLPRAGEALMTVFPEENGFFGCLLVFLFEKESPLAHYNYQMYAPLLLFFLYLLPLFLVCRAGGVTAAGPRSGRGKKRNAAAFLILTVMATAVVTVDIPGKMPETAKVVLYNQGYLNWQVPSFTMFGSKSAGMFGNLPPLLESMGFSVEKADAITPDVLTGARILVMINVDRELPREALAAIRDFVDNGGSLLLLGDHTFYKHGINRIILNDILQPCRIRYNFDSADWFIGGWLHSYQYAGHSVTAGMRDDMNDAGIVVGASLFAPPPAFPLVIGKYGYSDPGSEVAGDKRGYLGNLNYDPGEPLGDVVLCAAEYHGKGKVLVFGDTSSFANGILVNSHDFVNRVFSWLAREESPTRYRLALAVGLFLLAQALLFYRGSSRMLYLPLIACLLSLGVVRLAEGLKQYHNSRELKGPVAYVDASHGERFSPESWNDNAVLGLHLNLMRNGYLSFTLWNFDEQALREARLLVLIAPSQPFSRKEIGMIRNFVERGGTLMLSVGWEEREASLALLDAFGFSIEHLPLAQFISVIPAAGQKVRFFEAWPIASRGPGSEVIAAYQSFPVVMKQHYGNGTVVMIGDSSFFWNVNLEMEESHTEENVEFLRWLLADLKERPGGNKEVKERPSGP
jgi:hypothetical protein